jgi:esterase/lipase
MAETEYVLMGVIFLEISMREGFLPIHASAILYQNQAILFSAPSKTGKSTHANLWKQAYPEIEYINDDKPLLKIVGEEVMVYGSPIAGQKAINTNQHAPLKSIVFLSQGKTNTMKRASIDEALNLLMKNMLRPSDEENWNKALKTIEFIIKTIPIYTLDATKDLEAVYAVKKSLFEGEEQI